MKHIYRGVILFVVFIGSMIFMQRYMKDVTISFNTTVTMGESTFPLLYVQNGEHIVNEMHGYSSSLDAVIVRESMTYMDSSKNLTIRLADQGNEIRKIKYEVRLVSANEVVESDATSDILTDDTGKYVQITLTESYLQGKEYAMKLTAITSEGRKIHYYTRIKFYSDESYFEEKIKFATEFHDATFDKDAIGKYASYLEYGTTDNSTLAYVDINSSQENLSWGSLKPEIVSDVVPMFTEYTRETASVVFNYYVKANTGGKTEDLYLVNEFIRIRYANNRMYLLGYQRTMEEVFNSSLTDIDKNALKVGITNKTEMELHSSSEDRKLCFVQQGALWYYDTVENKAVRVFSFFDSKNMDYERSGYDHYDMNVINMNEDGDIDFMVYGYFNRGDYEGRVGVLLYKFIASENRIEELVYIPMETTYEMLKEDLNDYGYLSANGVFYFAIDNQIYSYNIASRIVTTVASDVSDEDIILLENKGYLAWQDSENAKKCKTIHLLNLETEEVKEIHAKEGENVILLGSSEDNIIYGSVKTSNIRTTKQGEQITPFYEVIICDGEGKVLKNYTKKDIYVKSVTVNNNVITLQRIKKSSDSATGYVSVQNDSIINNIEQTGEGFTLVAKESETALTEYYIELPSTVVLSSVPKQKSTVNTIITTNTTLMLEEQLSNMKKYYVFGYGTITGSYSRVADAVMNADKAMGAVMDSDYKIIWERGGKYLSNTISDFEKINTTGSIDSIGACIAMTLQFNGVSCNAEKISAMRESIDEILSSQYKGHTYNLTGCNLDQALYYVSAGVPVIAMKSSTQAVVLTGYDEYYVKYYDPSANMTQTMLLTNADSMFKESGYIFNVCMN